MFVLQKAHSSFSSLLSVSSQTTQPHRRGKRMVFANGASITGDWGLLGI